MKRALILTAILILILSISSTPVAQAGPENPGNGYVPDEVIVKFKPGANAHAIAQAMGRAYQCSNKCPARPGLGLGVRRLPCVHQEHNGSLADE